MLRSFPPVSALCSSVPVELDIVNIFTHVTSLAKEKFSQIHAMLLSRVLRISRPADEVASSLQPTQPIVSTNHVMRRGELVAVAVSHRSV